MDTRLNPQEYFSDELLIYILLNLEFKDITHFSQINAQSLALVEKVNWINSLPVKEANGTIINKPGSFAEIKKLLASRASLPQMEDAKSQIIEINSRVGTGLEFEGETWEAATILSMLLIILLATVTPFSLPLTLSATYLCRQQAIKEYEQRQQKLDHLNTEITYLNSHNPLALFSEERKNNHEVRVTASLDSGPDASP